ncbi:GNAT family N-acetyltransferase [Nocardioides sp. JQ2195]|uniref:GNAT family N-acetyltransferase n=1 Tax=Nocardioides sp. JQ2195 TaxID=2592334 RepID=UPI00143E8B88|nr:GNAT family N-acetyltransferase [Nocardioides sp. JQ2195]QIX26275.1 GNAT family N-acetyltransferase [Nocardioides sp. JQ2195]
MDSPTADVSVRVAWSDDAPGIAGVQVRAWRSSYADLLPAEVLAALTYDEVARVWHESLARPEDARNRVLVALERNRITGFATTTPSQDPDGDRVADGDIAEFSIDPDELGKGHGSRLLQACADTLRADRFTRATIWVNSDADAWRTFLESAGWAPDGAHRELDLRGDGTVTVKQVRLHTAL